VARRDNDNTREAYVVRSSRPASAIVRSRPSSEIIRERPSSERIITKRIEDDVLNTREVYVRRERPLSEIIRERPSSSRIVARRPRNHWQALIVRQHLNLLEYPLLLFSYSPHEASLLIQF
jgi:hypothetical protein